MLRWSQLYRRFCIRNEADSRLLFDHGRSLVRRIYNVRAAHGGAQPEAIRPRYHGDVEKFLASSLPAADKRKDAAAWINVLQENFPPHAQRTQERDIQDPVQQPHASAEQLAALLATARRSQYNVDLLQSLGEQGHWKTAVLLVTYLIDHLWKGNPTARHDHTPGPWSDVGNLLEATKVPLVLESPTNPIAEPLPRALIDVVETEHPLGRGIGSRIYRGHAVLGQIWQSLGNMILEDSIKAKPIRPEILEIIAVLHNRGIIPDQVYDYKPDDQPAVLRQPPTLHVLSSQIMTSLSDAAWMARENRIFGGTQPKSALSLFTTQRAIPAYNIGVESLGHEVWLELILWSCIHGGWTTYGAAIIDTLAKSKIPNKWSALSWRDTQTTASSITSESRPPPSSWTTLPQLFAAGRSKASFDKSSQRQRVAKTISSELLTAYLEAMVNQIRIGVGDRGVAPGAVIDFAYRIKSFLEQSNLGLEAISWDSIAQRLFEPHALAIAVSPGPAEYAIGLFPSFGMESIARNSPSQSEGPMAFYLENGTAASLGLSHRVLMAHLNAGNMVALLRAFKNLQSRTDGNKELSVSQFFSQLKHKSRQDSKVSFDFRSSYAAVDYPAFHPQLPIPLLAHFLNLIIDAGDIQLGEWLLNSDDPDGPVFPNELRTHPAIIPSMIRFASVSGDRRVLQDVIQAVRVSSQRQEGGLPVRWLLSILESQLRLRDWTQIGVTLEALGQKEDLDRNIADLALANVARAYLPISLNDSKTPLKRSADAQFVQIARNRYQLGFDSTVSVLAVLAAVNQNWADRCLNFIPRNKVVFDLAIGAFNTILRGIVDAYGSDAGITLLAKFWRPARVGEERLLQEMLEWEVGEQEGTGRMSVERPQAEYRPSPHRVDLFMPRDTKTAVTGDGEEVRTKNGLVIRGRFRPNFSTIQIILSKYFIEQQQTKPDLVGNAAEGAPSLSESPTVQWAKRILEALGMQAADIEEEFQRDMRRSFSRDDNRGEADGQGADSVPNQAE